MKSGRWINLGKGKSNTQQAFWVAIGSLSSFSLGIVSSAVLSRYFPKEEYGTYKQIVYIYSTFLVIFTAGLPQVFAYFLPRYSINEGRAIVWKITKALFCSGAIFSIFLFFSSGIIAKFLNNPELELGLKVFSPIPFLLLPTLGIEGIFSTYRRTIFIGIYDTSTRFLNLLFIVLPVIILKGSYITAIYGWVLGAFISLLIASYLKGIPFKGIKAVKSSLSFKKIFSYSIPIVTASIAGIAISASDQFYISRYFGAEIFAEFSNGFIPLPFVGMITSASSIVLMPVFSKIIHEKSDISVLTNMWQNAIEKSAIIVYPLIVFFIYYASNIMVFLYSDAYLNSAIYFQISIVANFFNIIIFAPLLLSLGKTQFYSNVLYIFAGCIWGMSYILLIFIKSPIPIVILSTLLVIIKTLVFFAYSAKFIGVGFFQLFPIKRLFILILHSVLVLGIMNLLLIVMDSLNLEIGNTLEPFVSFPLYVGLLLLLSTSFKIDYSFLYRPVLGFVRNLK